MFDPSIFKTAFGSALALAVSFAVGSSATIADENCHTQCPTGAGNTNIVIERPIYTMSFDINTKFADWVAYKVTKDTIGRTAERKWKTDPDIPDNYELEPEDYKGAWRQIKTDRGHQVPLASFTGTPHWEMTNYLSNITPQKSNLNQGSWVRVENAVRALVRSEGDTYVVTGPLYEDDQEQMTMPGADEPHRVPTGYFKIVLHDRGGITAFVFDQDVPRNYDQCTAIVPLEEVEARSGLDILPLPSSGYDKLDTLLGC